MDFETIVNAITLLLGGGGIGYIVTLQYARRKGKAEADSAEAAATKELQDIYQQMITDVKTDRDEQKAYITELKEDRKHLREERDDLRTHIDELDDKVRTLEREVARNGRMVESLRPFLCGRQNCPRRVSVTLLPEDKEEQPTNNDNDNCTKRRQGKQGESGAETIESVP